MSLTALRIKRAQQNTSIRGRCIIITSRSAHTSAPSPQKQALLGTSRRRSSLSTIFSHMLGHRLKRIRQPCSCSMTGNDSIHRIGARDIYKLHAVPTSGPHVPFEALLAGNTCR